MTSLSSWLPLPPSQHGCPLYPTRVWHRLPRCLCHTSSSLGFDNSWQAGFFIVDALFTLGFDTPYLTATSFCVVALLLLLRIWYPVLGAEVPLPCLNSLILLSSPFDMGTLLKLQYYFFFPLLKLFQLWLLGALSVPRFSLTYFQPLVVFLKIYIFMCLSTSLFLGTTKCSRLIMFRPRISYSSKEPRFLSLETGGKNQVLVTRHTWIICIYYVHT